MVGQKSRGGGGVGGEESGHPLLDVAHLEAQTFGDRELEREVLTHFVGHLRVGRERVPGTGDAEFLHKLKGAALAVGAFAVARQCAEMEHRPASRDDWTRLAAFLSQTLEAVRARLAGPASPP